MNIEDAKRIVREKQPFGGGGRMDQARYEQDVEYQAEQMLKIQAPVAKPRMRQPAEKVEDGA